MRSPSRSCWPSPFTNGVHDASNAIATLVVTRVARPAQAMVLAACFKTLGPLPVGAAVADTIGGIVAVKGESAIAVIAAGLLSAVAWNAFTWRLGLPSSSGHALIGGLVSRHRRTAARARQHPRRQRRARLPHRFGVTKQRAAGPELTRTGMAIGTADYMAPEQARGREVDGRADVHSLGCVLFRALTGEVVFDRDSDLDKLWAHVHEPPPALLVVRPELPAALGDAVAHALEKEPADRPRTASGLAREARAAMVG